MSGQLYMGESGPACIVLGVAELGATDLPTTCLKDHMVLVGFGRVGSRLGEELQREEQPLLIIEDHTRWRTSRAGSAGVDYRDTLRHRQALHRRRGGVAWRVDCQTSRGARKALNLIFSLKPPDWTFNIERMTKPVHRDRRLASSVCQPCGFTNPLQWCFEQVTIAHAIRRRNEPVRWSARRAATDRRRSRIASAVRSASAASSCSGIRRSRAVLPMWDDPNANACQSSGRGRPKRGTTDRWALRNRYLLRVGSL